MYNKQFALGGIVNLFTLLIGLFFGFMFGTWHTEGRKVLAQSNPGVQVIEPIFTSGSAGIGTVLAHQIAADEIMVQGYDLLKLHEGTLNLLTRKAGLLFSRTDIQGVLDGSKAKMILKMKPPPEPSKPEPAKPEQKGAEK